MTRFFVIACSFALFLALFTPGIKGTVSGKSKASLTTFAIADKYRAGDTSTEQTDIEESDETAPPETELDEGELPPDEDEAPPAETEEQ